MSTENLAPKVKEARIILEDIKITIENIDDWCLKEAAIAINKLPDRWANICSTAKDTEPDVFIQQCEEILADCEAFRDQIDKQRMKFTTISANRQDVIKKVAGTDNDTKLLMEQISQHWNETTQPQLVLLYKKLEELEQSIRE